MIGLSLFIITILGSIVLNFIFVYNEKFSIIQNKFTMEQLNNFGINQYPLP